MKFKRHQTNLRVQTLTSKTLNALEPEFDKMWKAANISGIRGHRDVGGYRASLYNALPLESVQVLVDVMKEFEKIKG